MDGIDFQTVEPELDFVSLDEEKPSKIRSILSAAPKGFAKELREQLTKTLGFLPKKLGLVGEEEQLSPISEEEFIENIEKILPTQEGFAEKALERGGRIAPYAITGGGNVAAQALRSALAGFLGEGAKEAGLPEWAQALAELPAFAAPSFAKTIIPKGSQKELVEGARKLKLSEQEITPLIQGEKKTNILAKLSPRRGRTKKLLDKSYKALGNVYDRFDNIPSATKEISPGASRKVLESINEKMKDFPAALRKVVQDDLTDLIEQPITGSSLINFFKDLNYNIGKGHNALGILKEPIFKALEDISPELAQDFRLTNKLYAKYATISNKLKPSLVSDLYSAGEAVRLLMGLSMGNLPLIAEIIPEHGARLLSRELLLNPRLQNLSKKMLNALNEGKNAAANQFLKSYLKELEENNPEIAEELKDIDFKSILHENNK